MRSLKNPRGFTLIELLIAFAITGIVAAAIHQTFVSQLNTYTVQDRVAEMQQNLRAGLDRMTREIRMAGYDPDSTLGSGITAIANNSITFTLDDGTGALNASTYGINANNSLVRNNQPVAEDIDALGLAFAYDADGDGAVDSYTDASGQNRMIWAINNGGNWNNLDTNNDGVIDDNDSPNPGTANTESIAGTNTGTPVDLENIRAVKIWLLARANRGDRNFVNNFSYIVGDQKITPNDNFRRRLLTTTVKCRNMELD